MGNESSKKVPKIDSAEEWLAEQLQQCCDKNGAEREENLPKSAKILHKIAKMYQKRTFKTITDQMIGFI